MQKLIVVILCFSIVIYGQENGVSTSKLLDKISHNSNSMFQFSKSKLSNFTQLLREKVFPKSRFVSELLLDPYPIADFNLSSNQNFVRLETQLKDVHLRGLSKMEVQSLKLNLVNIHVQSAIKIPVLLLNGTYDLHGKVTFFRISGNGAFWMRMTDVLIHVAASLNKSSAGELQVSNIALDVHADDITVHFDNLMGKSAWSDVYNTVLNTLSNLMFDEVKHIVLNEMEDEIRKRVNEQLSKLPKHMVYEDSATVFDAFLERSKAAIAEKYEPFQLAHQRKHFSTRVFRFNVTGELKLYDGVVNGLTTLTRTGDIIAEYSNDSVVVTAELGFENLTSSYLWSAKLMGTGPSGSASVAVNSISAHIRLRQLLTKNSKPTLEEFKINNIKHVWVDIKGLGGVDFLLEIFINLISNTFKRSLAVVISGPVRDAIQKELNALPMSFV